ncbi:MAG TPA: bifunctional UDP-sugar hydrolase/5'-nucleotidase [bacterium]|nr:bifunctional UDP-sugar hydrolase/5'-nucleotidase [bacterium]
MRNRWTRITLVVLLAAAFIVACAGSQKPEQPAVYRLSILHFNDTHGFIYPHKADWSDQEVGGLARMIPLVRQIREQNDALGAATLVVSTGDFLQGTPLSSAFKGMPTVDLLNMMELDLTTVGNHEFDFGFDNFNKLVEASHFGWAVANLRKNGHDSPWMPLGTGMIKQYTNRLVVGMIGLTTPELVTGSHPKNVRDLVVDDPLELAKKLARRHDAMSDLLIVLSHCGVAIDKQIAREMPGVDVIVGGHDHELFTEPVVENGVMIVQAGEHSEHLGRMDLEVSEDKARLIRYKVYPITADLPEDRIAKARLESYLGRLSEMGREVIGEALTELVGRREVIRRAESNFGDFVADTIRERFTVDVVLINAGSFRTSLQPGPITVNNVHEVFPYDNTLVTLDVPGAVIREALEIGLQKNPEANPGAFLQVAGLRYVIDDKRATQITVGGEPLDETRNYKIAINDYMLAGGDAFTMFKNAANVKDTKYTIADVVIEAIKAQEKIDAPTDGRISRAGAWTAN